MNAAEGIFFGLQVYGFVGAIVAVLFLTFGIDRIDEDARGAYVFRPLMIPGVLVIWPLVVWRWLVLERGRDRWQKRYNPPRRSHPIFAIIMSFLIIGIIATGWSQRQVWPADVAPEQLSGAQTNQ